MYLKVTTIIYGALYTTDTFNYGHKKLNNFTLKIVGEFNNNLINSQ